MNEALESGSDPQFTLADIDPRGRGDLALAFTWILFGAAFVLESQRIKLISVEDPLGPRLVPRVIGAFMIVLGVAVAIDTIRRQRLRAIAGDAAITDDETLAEEVTERRPSSTRRGLITMVISSGYVGLMPLIGYVPSTIIGCLAVSWYLRDREHPLLLIGLSIALTYGTYWVFTDLLNVQLPVAVWT